VREYELTFVVQPEISEEGCTAIRERLDGLLERHQATRLMCEDWGKRKLAYEIEKFQKGHYYTLSFLDDGKVVPELERALRLDDSVLRFLTIVADENVKEIEERKARAAEQERIQTQKQAERAAREAEEAKARQEAEAQAREEAASARAGASDQDPSDEGEERSGEEEEEE
jgi:small subunit ribosomal protein S6